MSESENTANNEIEINRLIKIQEYEPKLDLRISELLNENGYDLSLMTNYINEITIIQVTDKTPLQILLIMKLSKSLIKLIKDLIMFLVNEKYALYKLKLTANENMLYSYFNEFKKLLLIGYSVIMENIFLLREYYNLVMKIDGNMDNILHDKIISILAKYNRIQYYREPNVLYHHMLHMDQFNYQKNKQCPEYLFEKFTVPMCNINYDKIHTLAMKFIEYSNDINKDFFISMSDEISIGIKFLNNDWNENCSFQFYSILSKTKPIYQSNIKTDKTELTLNQAIINFNNALNKEINTNYKSQRRIIHKEITSASDFLLSQENYILQLYTESIVY
jgi:hypothetical protein